MCSRGSRRLEMPTQYVTGEISPSKHSLCLQNSEHIDRIESRRRNPTISLALCHRKCQRCIPLRPTQEAHHGLRRFALAHPPIMHAWDEGIGV